MGIRGGAISGPYAGGPLLRPAIEPGTPLGRDDPHHVRQVLRPRTTALLNGEKPEFGCAPDRTLGEAPAYAGTRRDLTEAPIAGAMFAELVNDDP